MERTSSRTPARLSTPTRLALLAVVTAFALAVAGCSDGPTGGLSLFAGDPEPAETLERLDEAALARDEAAFAAYLDIDSIAAHAYTALIAELRQTPEYQEMVAQLGEEQAEQILKEDVLAYDEVSERISAAFALSAIPEGETVFGAYSLTSSDIGEYEAELTIVSENDGEERTYVLGLVMETYPDLGRIWRIKEIGNITSLINFQAS